MSTDRVPGLLDHIDTLAADLAAARLRFDRVRAALYRLKHEALHAREEYDADNAVADFDELLTILTTDPAAAEESRG